MVLRAHRAHDAELVVAAEPGRDAGQLPDQGIAAVGPDEEARAEPRRRFPGIDDDFASSERDAGNPHRPAPRHPERAAGFFESRRDHPVFHDGAEMGLADRLRLEPDPGAARRLPDLDPPERGGGIRDPLPDPEPAEDPLRRDGERAHPAVARGIPRTALHHRRFESGAGETRRGHQAGKAPPRRPRRRTGHRPRGALQGPSGYRSSAHRPPPPRAKASPDARGGLHEPPLHRSAPIQCKQSCRAQRRHERCAGTEDPEQAFGEEPRHAVVRAPRRPVPGQPLRRVAAVPRLAEHLGQCLDVAQPEVEALCSNRMQGVRRVSDEYRPLGGDPRCVAHPQAVKHAGLDPAQLAEPAPECSGQALPDPRSRLRFGGPPPARFLRLLSNRPPPPAKR